MFGQKVFFCKKCQYVNINARKPKLHKKMRIIFRKFLTNGFSCATLYNEVKKDVQRKQVGYAIPLQRDVGGCKTLRAYISNTFRQLCTECDML